MLSHDFLHRHHTSVPVYFETRAHDSYFLNMAAADGVKRRGRYKEYLRHHNPYRVEAARTRHRRRNCRKTDPLPDKPKSVDNKSFPEFKGKEVFQFRDQCNESSLRCELVNTCDFDENSMERATLPSDELKQDTLKTRHLEFEGILDSIDSEVDEDVVYQCFISEDVDDCDTSLESASDFEEPEEGELPAENCDSNPDDMLYAGAPITSSMSSVLLLTFAMKHKLTREAFNDLLSVIEAHCPRPNNCKTTVRTLLEFVGEAKGDIVKHYYCEYCKAYFGRDTGTCNLCGQSISKAGGFFIEVPVEKQLQNFFAGKVFCAF